MEKPQWIRDVEATASGNFDVVDAANKLEISRNERSTSGWDDAADKGWRIRDNNLPLGKPAGMPNNWKGKYYVDKFRDLLEFTNTKVDPLDRFIKEVVSETDLYYTLTGLSKEERLDKFTGDMKRINEANKPPTEAEMDKAEKEADKVSLSVKPGEE